MLLERTGERNETTLFSSVKNTCKCIKMVVLQIHRSFAAMQKVGVIRSIRSDIKAEKKRQCKEQRNYKRVLLRHIKFRLSICDHDFHISSLQVYNKRYKKKQLSPVSTVSCLSFACHTLSTFFHQNLKRQASECNWSLDQDQDRSISSSIASC